MNEKRAAVGYAPLDEPPPQPATENDTAIVLQKYRPNQARAPRGDPDGGQWVDEGGGGGGSGRSDSRTLSDTNSDGADFWKPGAQVAQARRPLGPVRTVNVRGRNYSLHESLAGEVESALRRVDEAQKRARELDPDWKPLASARSTEPTSDVQTVLRGLRMEAQEAEGRITVIERGGVPLGFNAREDFHEFGRKVWRGLSEAGHRDAVPYMRGSAVTGHKYETGEVFDVGRTSDYDLAIVSPTLLKRAVELGVRTRAGARRTVQLDAKTLVKLGLGNLQNDLQRSAKRKVSIMIYETETIIQNRGPYIPVD